MALLFGNTKKIYMQNPWELDILDLETTGCRTLWTLDPWVVEVFGHGPQGTQSNYERGHGHWSMGQMGYGALGTPDP